MHIPFIFCFLYSPILNRPSCLNVYEQWRNMGETMFKCIYVIRNTHYVQSTGDKTFI